MKTLLSKRRKKKREETVKQQRVDLPRLLGER